MTKTPGGGLAFPVPAAAPRRSASIVGLGNLWEAPDQVLIEAGAEGEWLVTRIRLLALVLLAITPTWRLLRYPDSGEYFWGWVITMAALAMAVGIWILLRNGAYRPWIGFASSAFDVSFISLALFLFVLIGPPHSALNSRVTYEVYFLAIFASSLRYDRRICLAAGALAIVSYIAIVAYAVTHYDLNGPAYADNFYGRFSMADQVSRVILLVIAIILAEVVVIRAQRLRYLSTRDRLTELFNRTYFDQRALSEVERARRYRHELAVAMIDVDHFKRFNDSYGHPEGDKVLKAIADQLKSQMRQSDIVARYGGEEFVVLLPETGHAGALEKLEAMRRAVQATAIVLPRKSGIRELTVSAGIAVLPADGEDLATLLGRADARMFAAKNAGRNRVVIEEPSAEVTTASVGPAGA